MRPKDMFAEVFAEDNIAKHFNITHLHSPTIACNKQGMMLSVLQIKGVPFTTATAEQLNYFNDLWHKALLMLSVDVQLYTTVQRRKIVMQPTGATNNKFINDVTASYAQVINNSKLYVNELFVVICVKPPINTNKVFKAETQRKLEDCTAQLLAVLKPFTPKLLGTKDAELGYSELINYISMFVNAGQELRCCYQDLAGQNSELYPAGGLCYFIPRYQILFNKYIKFHGATDSEHRYAAIIGIKNYGKLSSAIMFAKLLKLPVEYILTNSFAIVEKDKAVKRIGKIKIKKEVSDAVSSSDSATLPGLQSQVQSDDVKLGLHHNSIMIIAATIAECEQAVTKVIAAYLEQGIVVTRETLGLEAAFWAQIPGNNKYIARSALLSSENFADYFPLHNYPNKEEISNHLQQPVTIAVSPGNTPVNFHLHGNSSQDNPAVGHTVMIGGNGSGKTVAMCFLDSQLMKFAGRSVFFDRNNGLAIYVHACGGKYYSLSPLSKDAVSLNPLALPDLPANRVFLQQWLQQLLLRPEEKYCDKHTALEVKRAVDYMYSYIPAQERCLSVLANYFSINFARHDILQKYLQHSTNNRAGVYGFLFDNKQDNLEFGVRTGFDMTYLLDISDRCVSELVAMYLFHRIEQELDGRLMSIFLDEGWQYLANQYWQDKLSKWLPTLRKLNCHVVIATQSPQSVSKSPIAHTILDNCATQIYFANPMAKAKDYCDCFNLSAAEYDCVRNTSVTSRYFLYKQQQSSCMCKFPLQGMDAILKVFSATAASVKLMTQLQQASPDNWLQEFMGSQHEA